METEADHLSIIFRVGGLGFVMPVAALMAIRDLEVLDSRAAEESFGPCQSGNIQFQNVTIPVFDLMSFLQLPVTAPQAESRYLVFSGDECPWAIVVDRVDGLFPRTVFDEQGLPAYLFETGGAVYDSVAVRNGEPLVSFEPEVLGRRLVEGS